MSVDSTAPASLCLIHPARIASVEFSQGEIDSSRLIGAGLPWTVTACRAGRDTQLSATSQSRVGEPGVWRMMWACSTPLLLLLLCLVVVPAASAADGVRVGSAPAPSGPSVTTAAGIARPYGIGAEQVWVMTPNRGAPKNVVVYLHGWGANLPFYWHLKWIDHLLARGSAVIFPTYQAGNVDDPWISTPWNLEVGLRAGFGALGRPGLPVVAAGFSVGATLSFFYAANARAWGLPRPRAVFSVFPVDPKQIDPLRSPPPLKGKTRILIMVGDSDTTVGRLRGGRPLEVAARRT